MSQQHSKGMTMTASNAGDIVFTPAVRAAQQQRGSREMYENMDRDGGFPGEINERLAAFIAARDSFYLGTANRQGQPYIQHRGGKKGFLKVLDERTLAFGDVAGNAQYISIGNLSENDHAFLFLMDYPNRRRVKIWGTAEVVENDVDLLQRLTVDERPERAIVFRITTWNSNCPKNIAPRWTMDELDGRMQTLTDQLEQLKRENRLLKRQLKEHQTKGNP
ncbi:MAG: pyridoxamine 5'-phosphate oxidase family protein [Rhodopirellula sp. JB053]